MCASRWPETGRLPRVVADVEQFHLSPEEVKRSSTHPNPEEREAQETDADAEEAKVPLARTDASPTQGMFSQPIFSQLRGCKRVLIAGCGGGYDMFAGLPFYFALRRAGIAAYLANLTFTHGTEDWTGRTFGMACLEVTAGSINREDPITTGGSDYEPAYFPELELARWFRERGEDVPVYTFRRSGVRILAQSYRELCDHLQIDAIVLADGGTDSLMFGDEADLGTPFEDSMSMAAIMHTTVPVKLLVCLGMGIDTFHGVNHARFLENVAACGRNGGFLGCFSLMREMQEAQDTLAAFNACQPANSIVNSSVALALDYQFGNVHHSSTVGRTGGSQLFINPLMSLYWCFSLPCVAQLNQYLDKIKDTRETHEIRRVIHEHHAGTTKRGNLYLPI